LAVTPKALGVGLSAVAFLPPKLWGQEELQQMPQSLTEAYSISSFLRFSTNKNI